jgi:hypothetical protein
VRLTRARILTDPPFLLGLEYEGQLCTRGNSLMDNSLLKHGFSGLEAFGLIVYIPFELTGDVERE